MHSTERGRRPEGVARWMILLLGFTELKSVINALDLYT